MKIIYTCPKCDTDLIDMVLTSNPPQYKKFCPKCGWSASETNKNETVIRVPYDNRENVSVTTWAKSENVTINGVNSLTPTYAVDGTYKTVNGSDYTNKTTKE